MTPLLTLSRIDTFYGPVQVHFGLSLEVPRGQIVSLLGGNASGKSTTMKVILGLLHPRAGQVQFDGADITLLPTPQVIRRGIGSRALMGRPRLLCMDEPTMGLSPLYVDRVLELIQAVNKDGVTIFMVEQNASLALAIADYGYVLQAGRIMLSGPAAALMRDPRIRDAYLGGETTKAL